AEVARRTLPDLGEDGAQACLQLVDIDAEEEQALLDVLDGVALGHQRLDERNATHDLRRVQAPGAEVLAFLPHPHAARQKPDLYVFAQRRFAEAHAARGEQIEDLRGSKAVGPGALELP